MSMSKLHEHLITNWYICIENNCPHLSQIIISTKRRQDRTLYRIHSPMNISWQTHWRQQISIFNQVIRQCTQTIVILAVSRYSSGYSGIFLEPLKKEPRVATVDFHRCLDFRDGVPRWPGKINRRRGI